MTERKITYALNKIKSCTEAGYHYEALIRAYLLNVDLIRFILSVSSPQLEIKGKKSKTLVKIFLDEMSDHPELKSIINKKSLKALKPWLTKMDQVFKGLKMGEHTRYTALQLETEKIFGILKISANKLLLKERS